MIYRFMFMAYSKTPEKTAILPDIPHYAALAMDGERVFLYVEANENVVDPNQIATGELIPYPNGKNWERAADIFHYSVPMNSQQWKRNAEKTPYFRINRLQYDRISSYIYYHFQYQEEYPGDGDKYGVIYLLGDTMVFYEEKPEEKETEKRDGLLQSKNSPMHIWEELMTTHFADRWRLIENLGCNAYIDFE